MTLRIMQGEPPAHILKPDPGTGSARVVRLLERARVLDVDMQDLAFGKNADTNLKAVLAPTVFDGILDQRLQQEARDAALRRLGRHIDDGLKPLAEARLLHAEIGVETADLEA